MFEFFKKKRQLESATTSALEEQLGEEHAVNFDEIVQQISRQSNRAQATFLYKLVGALQPKLLKTLLHYILKRLGNDKNPKFGSRLNYIGGEQEATRKSDS